MAIVLPDRADQGGPFTPEKRAIFAYGLAREEQDWRGDPLAIEVRYETAVAAVDTAALQRWLDRGNVSVRLNGLRRLLPIVRHAFGLPAFDEAHPDGLTAGGALQLLDRFFAYQDRIRAQYRREAELLVTYGPLPGRVHTYEREVGLWWNRERAQAFAGVAAWRGALAAAGTSTAHPALVDAMAPNEEAARRLGERLEADRIEAEARARNQPGRARA